MLQPDHFRRKHILELFAGLIFDPPIFQHAGPVNQPGSTIVYDVRASYAVKDTVARFLPYWHETIAPVVRSGKSTIIAAHGNSLRALVKYLDDVSDEAIVELNIPTGIPLVYELDEGLRPLRHYYLGDQAAIEAAMQAVANQGKAKSG